VKPLKFIASIFALFFVMPSADSLGHVIDLSGVFDDPVVAHAVESGVIVGAGAAVLYLTPSLSGVHTLGVNKELWVDLIKEGFYPDDSFLMRSVDLTAFVDNSVLHAAEAGVDPTVLIDNTTYPIAVAPRTDTPLDLPLSTYDSENTVVRNVDEMQTAYDKMASVTRQHQKAIRKKFVQKALHAWAPSSDATLTPVIATTGADNGSGLKRLKIADIITAQNRFDEADIDQEGRVLVLCPKHKADLLLEDAALVKAFANVQKGEVLKLYGFDVYVNSQTATYNKSTGVKKAFGAAAAGTDTHSSLFYHEDEVFRANGDYEMFYTEKSPTERGDIVGFQMRGLCLPVRSKAIGALYSPAA